MVPQLALSLGVLLSPPAAETPGVAATPTQAESTAAAERRELEYWRRQVQAKARLDSEWKWLLRTEPDLRRLVRGRNAALFGMIGGFVTGIGSGLVAMNLTRPYLYDSPPDPTPFYVMVGVGLAGGLSGLGGLILTDKKLKHRRRAFMLTPLTGSTFGVALSGQF